MICSFLKLSIIHFRGCHGECNIHLQLIEAHFQITLYHFTGNTSNKILLIPLLSILYCFHSFPLYKHAYTYIHIDINTQVFTWIHCLYYFEQTVMLDRLIKKLFYFHVFLHQCASFLDVDLSFWPETFSLWRTSFNTSCKASLLAKNSLNLCLRSLHCSFTSEG